MGGLEELKKQGVVEYHCRWLDQLRALVLSIVQGIDKWTPSFTQDCRAGQESECTDQDSQVQNGSNLSSPTHKVEEKARLISQTRRTASSQEDPDDDVLGFDTEVLKKAVDRYIRACKSLMLEYESGCKECAARAIMQWSLFQLADIESRLLHDPGSSQKRKIFTAGKKALEEGLTIACLGFGKIAKQKGDRVLGKVLAGAAARRARDAGFSRSQQHKDWLVSKNLLKQPSTTPKPPSPIEGTGRSLMSLVLELSSSYQTIDGRKRAAIEDDEETLEKDENALAAAKAKIITDFFPPGNSTVKRMDGLTLTPYAGNQAQEDEGKNKRLKGVASGVRNRIRVSMALGSASKDKLDVSAIANTAGIEETQAASDAPMALNASCTVSSCPTLQEHTSQSSSSRTRQPARQYFYGHTSSSFHRTASVMPIKSIEGGGGWASESHKWEVDGGIAAHGTAHNASVDRWPSDIHIPPPSSEDGHLAITRPHIVLHGQTFRVRLDKESLDSVFEELAIHRVDTGQPLAEIAKMLPSWQIMEPIKLGSIKGGGQAEGQGEGDEGDTGTKLDRPPARADQTWLAVSQASQIGGSGKALGQFLHPCRDDRDDLEFLNAEYLDLARFPSSPGERASPRRCEERPTQQEAQQRLSELRQHVTEGKTYATSGSKSTRLRSRPFSMYTRTKAIRQPDDDVWLSSRKDFVAVCKRGEGLTQNAPLQKRSLHSDKRLDFKRRPSLCWTQQHDLNMKVERRLLVEEDERKRLRETRRGLVRTERLIQTFAKMRDLKP